MELIFSIEGLKLTEKGDVDDNFYFLYESEEKMKIDLDKYTRSGWTCSSFIVDEDDNIIKRLS